MNSTRSNSSLLWDLWCVLSIVGIWPRFIEPYLISVSPIQLKIPNLPEGLKNFKILQFSDLHIHPGIPDFFLKKILKKCRELKPDMIVFSGDFLCYGRLTDRERLKNFIKSFDAPYGCYAILGNHDYSEAVSIDDEGNYDLIENNVPPLSKGFKRLFSTTRLSKQVTSRASQVPLHRELIEILKDSPFELLHNSTKTVQVKDTGLNVSGLGEYMLGRSLPKETFRSYDHRFPGIILAHNPDSIPRLLDYPGDVILCGHTHGGQVNLPWMWKKFTLLENMQFKKGLLKVRDKWIYVNRGISSIMPFRWFAKPEILFLTLES